jgi:hypothetical protein
MVSTFFGEMRTCREEWGKIGRKEEEKKRRWVVVLSDDVGGGEGREGDEGRL